MDALRLAKKKKEDESAQYDRAGDKWTAYLQSDCNEKRVRLLGDGQTEDALALEGLGCNLLSTLEDIDALTRSDKGELAVNSRDERGRLGASRDGRRQEALSWRDLPNAVIPPSSVDLVSVRASNIDNLSRVTCALDGLPASRSADLEALQAAIEATGPEGALTAFSTADADGCDTLGGAVERLDLLRGAKVEEVERAVEGE